MVFGLVSAVSGFFKYHFLADRAVIDNALFRCHYRITSAIFFLSCILCTAHSLLGPAIECIYDDKKNENVINTYCWVTSTFTVREYENANRQVGRHIAHPGVGPVDREDEESKRYHAYYQWVPFVLFLQGILFYMPHWIWKKWEGGKVGMISDGLRGVLAETREQRTKIQSRLVRYLIDSISIHTWYAIGYYFCEVLNFFNVIFNIFLTNKFLGGMFLTYGIDAIQHDGDEPDNPFTRVFPRVTKCIFHKYGPSGTIQPVDSMCVLAVNIINEKIYIFLWFWFIILAIISGVSLIYSLGTVLFPGVRKMILEHRFKFRVPQAADALIARIKVGDFLLLHLLGQNINTVVFGDILNDMSRELSNPHGTAPPNHHEMAPMYPNKQFLAH
ncbi:innexin inx3 [Anabrus simplex]|uniref:innexin inx3 n=1 Tax=Anabrus simplex TaxID=316456 RepID=UPI0034DDB483